MTLAADCVCRFAVFKWMAKVTATQTDKIRCRQNEVAFYFSRWHRNVLIIIIEFAEQQVYNGHIEECDVCRTDRTLSELLELNVMGLLLSLDRAARCDSNLKWQVKIGLVFICLLCVCVVNVVVLDEQW